MQGVIPIGEVFREVIFIFVSDHIGFFDFFNVILNYIVYLLELFWIHFNRIPVIFIQI